MKKYIYLLLVISVFLIGAWLVKIQKEPSYNFKDVQEVLLKTYNSLTNETCLEASQMMVLNLSKNGIGDVRFLQFFADPAQSFETHVAVEVKIPGHGWVYVDPTFNGYYTSAESGELLNAYQIRSFVEKEQLNSLVWNQNKGIVKENYDITEYYINPLYVFRGLMYARGENNYYIVDNQAIPFEKKGTKFQDYTKIIAIRDPKNVDSNIKSIPSYQVEGFKWGLDKGIKESISIKRKAGNEAQAELKKEGYYFLEFPIDEINEEIQVMIKLQSQTIKESINNNDQDQYFMSRVFYSSKGLINVSIEGVDLKQEAYIKRVANDFKDKIKIVNAP